MSNTTNTSAPSGIETGKFTHEQRMAATAGFKIYGDGVTPLVRVGNVSTLDNGRRIINFNCKSIRDYNENRPNASMGYPTRPNTDAGGKVTQYLVDKLAARYNHIQKGDMVSLVIENGYVQEILPARSLAAQEFKVGDLHADNVDTETGEVLDADAPETTEQPADAAKGGKKGGKPAEGPKAAAKDEDGNDLPF